MFNEKLFNEIAEQYGIKPHPSGEKGIWIAGKKKTLEECLAIFGIKEEIVEELDNPESLV